MKKCTGCGRTDEKPLGLNKNGEPYLACCPDSSYYEITAVEWLLNEFQEAHKDFGGLDLEWLKRFNQAKEMEKQQIIDAVNETMEEMNLYESFRTLKNGEQYYNETFKKD